VPAHLATPSEENRHNQHFSSTETSENILYFTPNDLDAAKAGALVGYRFLFNF
jgi:hypothetical protein